MNYETLPNSTIISMILDKDDPLDFDLVVGDGGTENPIIAFCDDELTVYSEQYSYQGRWRGWRKEALDKKEYFKRKLKGK